LRHPGDQVRIAFDPGVLAAQPAVEPAQAFLQEADGGARHAEVRVAVTPGADQRLGGRLDILHRLGHRADVGAIGPAADGENRRLDLRPIACARAPVVVVGLVLERGDDLRRVRFQTLHPHLAPAAAHELRIGRTGLVAEELARPADRAQQDRAAAKHLAVSIAVGRERLGDDGLELLGGSGCDLYPLKAAPRDAEHAHLPVAPRLLGDPLHGFDGIERFIADGEGALRAVRVAGAADVDAHAGIAVAGEVAVMHRVARCVNVALAIRDDFDDRGNPLVRRDVGKP
jgi:hypothetical protein